MKIDVFVSYHTETARDVAKAVVDKLERRGLRCWYAPRDEAGDFAESIVDAIDCCSVFVVLLNESACKSKHVGREVSYACEIDGLEVIPFRITDVQLYGKLKYYLKPLHWVDAVGSNRSSGMDELTKRVLRILGRSAPAKRIETIEYTDGSVYTGEVLNGKRHGKGKMVWRGGDVYEGDWVNDKRTGKGRYIWGRNSKCAGDVYEGDFVDGEPCGRGKYIWGWNTEWAGDVYVGDFVNGKRTGYGIYTYACGEVESGRFENNIYLGK